MELVQAVTFNNNNQPLQQTETVCQLENGDIGVQTNMFAGEQPFQLQP